MAIVDALNKSMGLHKADTQAIADIVKKAIRMAKADSLAITDSFDRTVDYRRDLTDQVTITDRIGKAWSIVLHDIVTITDSGVARVAIHWVRMQVARMNTKRVGIARMVANRMNIARLPVFRYIFRRF